MSKERIKIAEELFDIMPVEYQDLVKRATFGNETRGWKDIGTAKELIEAIRKIETSGLISRTCCSRSGPLEIIASLELIVNRSRFLKSQIINRLFAKLKFTNCLGKLECIS